MLKRLFAFLLLGCLVLTVQGQVTPHRLQKLEKVKINCQEETLLSKTYTISKDGIILVDFLGAVEIAGLTEVEAADKISKRLVEDRILRSATIEVKSLDVATTTPESKPESKPETKPESKPEDSGQAPKVDVIKFSGASKGSGDVEFKSGMTTADVALAAGVSSDTDLSKTIVRSSDGKVRLVDATQPVVLAANDEVVFTAKAPEPPTEVFVFGGVQTPGVVRLSGARTARAAIEAAGGFTVNSVKKKVKIEREGQPTRTLDFTNDSIDEPLKSNDRVVVDVIEKRAYVQVEGAVNSPGFFVVSPGMKLGDALEAAGGYSPKARLEKIQVFSTGVKKPTNINFQEIEQGYRGDVLLQPGDRIVVPGPQRNDNRTLKIAAGAAAIWYLFGR